MEKDNIFSLIEDIKTKENTARKTIIYGAGGVASCLIMFFERYDIRVDACCVTEKNPDQNEFMGYPIIEWKDVEKEDFVILAVNKENAASILNNVIDEEYRANVVYDEAIIQYADWDNTTYLAGEVEDDGKYILRVCDIELKKDFKYVCCPCSIGDTLYVCSLLNAYKKSNNKKICVIAKKFHEELVKMFDGIDDVIISNQAVSCLEKYSVTRKVWERENYLYGYFHKDVFDQLDKSHYNSIEGNMVEKYKHIVLGIPGESEMSRPGIPTIQGYENVAIIAPYAQTEEMLPGEFWDRLVWELKDIGLEVLTNVKDSSEKEVGGTARFSGSLSELAQVGRSCKCVISLRSGICDLLALVDSNIIIINNKYELKDEWSVSSINQRHNCRELQYCDDNEVLVNQVIEIIKEL
ncbi:hypothetical protein [Eubacterium xylanophilum]|uniref:hypothetical protein n=1 Tax=Eubacterium xylanophilum TaxID=39497 RepID=UPI00047EB142|nr:hypothetical protein [Eubacterium xylanophilum]